MAKKEPYLSARSNDEAAACLLLFSSSCCTAAGASAAPLTGAAADLCCWSSLRPWLKPRGPAPPCYDTTAKRKRWPLTASFPSPACWISSLGALVCVWQWPRSATAPGGNLARASGEPPPSRLSRPLGHLSSPHVHWRGRPGRRMRAVWCTGRRRRIGMTASTHGLGARRRPPEQ